ncbi:hypothetical protein HK099_008673 [Clydaea vesicula]|uniref:Cyclin-like domain-containing protein n=1 Tax=Clydaea vesicula TaxID=447962 RepID=A0AAD5XSZ0_9FUNG|nr:hypothetical protein HK099_008673 [Clydaea vesicula]
MINEFFFKDLTADQKLRLYQNQKFSSLKYFINYNKFNLNSRLSLLRKFNVVWLRELAILSDSPLETYLLSCNYFDRFVSKEDLDETYFNILSATCFLLAAKFHQVNCPALSQLKEYCDDSFGIASFDEIDLKDMEFVVLENLKWDLKLSTSMSFLEHYLTMLTFNSEVNNENCSHSIKLNLDSKYDPEDTDSDIKFCCPRTNCSFNRLKPLIEEYLYIFESQSFFLEFMPYIKAAVALKLALKNLKAEHEVVDELLKNEHQFFKDYNLAVKNYQSNLQNEIDDVDIEEVKNSPALPNSEETQKSEFSDSDDESDIDTEFVYDDEKSTLFRYEDYNIITISVSTFYRCVKLFESHLLEVELHELNYLDFENYLETSREMKEATVEELEELIDEEIRINCELNSGSSLESEYSLVLESMEIMYNVIDARLERESDTNGISVEIEDSNVNAISTFGATAYSASSSSIKLNHKSMQQLHNSVKTQKTIPNYFKANKKNKNSVVQRKNIIGVTSLPSPERKRTFSNIEESKTLPSKTNRRFLPTPPTEEDDDKSNCNECTLPNSFDFGNNLNVDSNLETPLSFTEGNKYYY